MTKSTLLRWLDEVANKLGEMRAALEQLPDAEDSLGDRITDQKSTEVAADRLHLVRFVDKEKLQPIVDNTFAAMGVRGEPIGAEKVQEMIVACGVRPEDNILSRGIIDMREE
jgi:flagellar basal body rod protein FlgG